ncbi:tyrosine-protein kinase Dnt isoform X2 [Folsomia candida]|uniref:tyrosine-protein kinase Dnt isoform X2 n=1 Tax=Folsomia candida TaxID=158441 RepID=UPI001605587B|nr:tyrosine-protein kinase Dnt isoform X2 [Folsomia candida]
MYKFLVILFVLIASSGGNFNFWMNGDEVKRILGLTKELYYVREGVPNTYALNFVVPLKVNVTELKFSWDGVPSPVGGKRGPAYTLSTTTSSSTILPIPTPSIPLTGFIPTTPTTFSIYIPCSGLKTAEVILELAINVTTATDPSQITSILLKRKKICLEGVKETAPKVPTSTKRQKKPHPQKTSISMVDEHKMENFTEPGLIYLIVGCVIGVGVVFVVVLGMAWIRKCGTNQKNHIIVGTSTTTTTTKSSNTSTSSLYKEDHVYSSVGMATVIPDYVNCLDYYRTDNYGNSKIVPRHKIRLQTLIQEGTYGLVYKATIQGNNSEKPILVKTVMEATPSHLQKSLLLAGFSTQKQHPNILHLIATTPPVEMGTEFVIYDLPEFNWWNLKSFLWNLDNLEGLDFLGLGLGVVDGLTFLHGEGVVHGDLGARCVGVVNCGGVLVAKLSDGSLAKDLFPEDYCHDNCGDLRALRWVGPEGILQERNSISGDVWSLGILFWEMYTSSKIQPYSEVSITELFSYLQAGFRLPQPENCEDGVWGAVIDNCWGWACDGRNLSGLRDGLVKILMRRIV